MLITFRFSSPEFKHKCAMITYQNSSIGQKIELSISGPSAHLRGRHRENSGTKELTSGQPWRQQRELGVAARESSGRRLLPATAIFELGHRCADGLGKLFGQGVLEKMAGGLLTAAHQLPILSHEDLEEAHQQEGIQRYAKKEKLKELLTARQHPVQCRQGGCPCERWTPCTRWPLILCHLTADGSVALQGAGGGDRGRRRCPPWCWWRGPDSEEMPPWRRQQRGHDAALGTLRRGGVREGSCSHWKESWGVFLARVSPRTNRKAKQQTDPSKDPQPSRTHITRTSLTGGAKTGGCTTAREFGQDQEFEGIGPDFRNQFHGNIRQISFRVRWSLDIDRLIRYLSPMLAQDIHDYTSTLEIRDVSVQARDSGEQRWSLTKIPVGRGERQNTNVLEGKYYFFSPKPYPKRKIFTN